MSDLIIATELAREPGNSRSVHMTLTLPERLGTDVIAIPAGAELELDLLLESVMEGILVTGTARGTLEGECVRCLASIEEEVEVELTELYAYPEALAETGEEDEEGEPVPVVEDETIDLSDLVIDAIVGDLPFNPVCSEDCPGLCPECGVRLADHPGHAHEAPIDPRWSALKELAGDDEP